MCDCVHCVTNRQAAATTASATKTSATKTSAAKAVQQPSDAIQKAMEATLASIALPPPAASAAAASSPVVAVSDR